MRPIVVTGSLYQNNPAHDLWQRAINETTRIKHTKPVLLSLVNHSFNCCSPDENKDKWRNLSGVFVDRSYYSNPVHLPAIRTVIDRDFSCAILRETECHVVAGPIRWSYGSNEGDYLWLGGLRSKICDDGSLDQPNNLDHQYYELARFVKRNAPSNIGETFPVVTKSLERIKEHLESGSCPNATSLFGSFIYGLSDTPRAERHLGVDDIHNLDSYLRAGLFTLSALLSSYDLDWQSSDEFEGQIISRLTRKHVLIWTDPIRHSIDLNREMQTWVKMIGDHNPLLVIAKGKIGSINEGEVFPDRHTDITESPDTAGRDITTPHLSRQIFSFQMQRIENLFVTPNEYDAITSIKGLLDAYISD